MWPENQRQAALEICPDGILDVTFPFVGPDADVADVYDKAIAIAEALKHGCTAAMVQGEYAMTYFLAKELAKRGIDVYVASLRPGYIKQEERNVRDFVKFRLIEGGKRDGRQQGSDPS